jgi:MFS family permease
MLSALRLRDFRLLWTARFVSSLGTWLLVIAIPAYVYEMTGSLVATGLTLFAEHLPPLLLGPLAGVLTDRFDRRRVMVATDLLRAGAISLLFLADGPGRLWLIYVALALESAGTMLCRPALQAHTPVVTGTGPLLNSANALNATTDGVVRLAGAPLGAAILTTAGTEVLIGLDVASYLLSAGAVLLMSRRPLGTAARSVSVRAVLAELRDGVAQLRVNRIASVLLLVNTTFLMANAALAAVLVPFGMTRLGGAEQVAVVMSGLGAGFLLGAPLTKSLLDRYQPRTLLAGSLCGTAAGYLTLFTSTSPHVAVPAAVLIGMFGSTSLVIPHATVQRVVPNGVLGRISAVLFAGEALATLTGSLAGPLVAGAGGMTAAALTACALTVGAAAMSLLLLPRVPAPAEAQ